VGYAGQACVVIDVLRATSVMVTGLVNGAAGFLPVAEISKPWRGIEKNRLYCWRESARACGSPQRKVGGGV
jgi:phosphosulfolactate phosphohydrolase-like enzyme